MATTHELPSPPAALAAIVAAASDPEVGLSRLGALVRRDPTFCATLLKVANSPRYCGHARSVPQATARLGTRALRNLALCQAARSCVSAGAVGGFDLDRFWEGSLRRAVAAELLFARGGLEGSEGFLVGLLQDLGVVVLVLENPSLALSYQAQVIAEPLRQREIERELFGSVHDEVVRPLLESWKFPDELASAIANHHTPPVGDIRAHLAGLAEVVTEIIDSCDPDVLQAAYATLSDAIQMTEAEVDEMVDRVGEHVKHAAAELGFKVGEQPSVERILRDANRSLVDMNDSYEELVQRLEQTIIEKNRLAADLERANQELQRLIVTDPLTGLANRRCFTERIGLELAQIARQGGYMTLLLGDIDRFKRINDTWGHRFGDEVLIGIAGTLAEAVRKSDLVVRMGGEEFVALLPHTNEAGGRFLAARILSSIRSMEFTAPTGQPVRVTLSLGMAVLQVPRGVRIDSEWVERAMYNAADQALYRAKGAGRNQVCEWPGYVPWSG